MKNIYKKEVEKLLKIADVSDLVVHDERFYKRVLRDGSLGFGESYMDGWWDVPSLDDLFYKIVRADLQTKAGKLKLVMSALLARVTNLQSKKRAFQVGEEHYDIGNELYEKMLDKRMVYTCGYWKNATNLDEAQEAKLDLVCRKLGLKRGDRVLDIGCGWGSFLKYAAEKYGVTGVGITVSKEQVTLAQKMCAGLPIEIRLQDYREINEQFDHVVSLGMFEHVGYQNYRVYMETVARCLKDGGLFLLHTVGGNSSFFDGDPWTNKYIFPNGMLPSIKQIGGAIENAFVMEDWHNFGTDYDKTLMARWQNFDKHWPEIKSNYNDSFYRMWKYYLMLFAGTFRARYNQLWQVVLSKNRMTGYESVR